MNTLLLGMGNPFLSDDAVGVRLAADFAAEARPWPDLEIIEECSLGGLNLIDVLLGFRRAIVLDSLQTNQAVPGTWHYFTAEALRETARLTNIHDANFATALELGRQLRLPLPANQDIHIFGVEIQDNRTFSRWMTPALIQAYPDLRAAIFKELNQLLAGWNVAPRSDLRTERAHLTGPTTSDLSTAPPHNKVGADARRL